MGLLVPEHQHHNSAMEWFTTEAVGQGWATCAVTELGVIRVCAQLPGGPWPPETTADRLLPNRWIFSSDGDIRSITLTSGSSHSE